MKTTMEWLLRQYKRWISPALPASCRFVPTCSEYAAEAVACHGVFYGSLLAIWRLLRCHPFGRGGWDPVTRKHLAFGNWHSAINDSREERITDSTATANAFTNRQPAASSEQLKHA